MLKLRSLPSLREPWLEFDRGLGLPEFLRVPYGEGTRVVRRCSCGRNFADPIGCQGRCPEPLSQESTGLCTLCGSGRHLPKGSVVRATGSHP